MGIIYMWENGRIEIKIGDRIEQFDQMVDAFLGNLDPQLVFNLTKDISHIHNNSNYLLLSLCIHFLLNPPSNLTSNTFLRSDLYYLIL